MLFPLIWERKIVHKTHVAIMENNLTYKQTIHNIGCSFILTSNLDLCCLSVHYPRINTPWNMKRTTLSLAYRYEKLSVSYHQRHSIY